MMGLRSRPWRALRRAILPLLAAGWLVGVPLQPGRLFAQGRVMPPPPKAPVRIYRPDGDTCQADNLLSTYRMQLLQFADQPPAVLARLRQIQLEMGEASLKTCAEANLLTREEAERIWDELQRMSLPGRPEDRQSPAGTQPP